MPLIRFALIADAVASGATGLLLAFGGSFLAGLTGVPADIAMPLGLFLVVFAAVRRLGRLAAHHVARPSP